MRYDLEAAARDLAKEIGETDNRDEEAILKAIREALNEAYAAGCAQS